MRRVAIQRGTETYCDPEYHGAARRRAVIQSDTRRVAIQNILKRHEPYRSPYHCTGFGVQKFFRE